MTYHTNHSWCSSSCWDDKEFDGEVMVYFNKHITQTDILSENNNSLKDIVNPDWKNLVKEIKFFDESKLQDKIEMLKRYLKKYLNTNMLEETSQDYLKLLEDAKELSMSNTVTLNEEVVEWLNQNIKDKKNTNGKTSLNKRKGWAIGNLSYNSTTSYSFNIFFYRQIDALKFIRKFSIFKEPIFYFDYFNDRERKFMDLNKMIHILNQNLEKNGLDKLIIDEPDLINKNQGDTNLDPMSFNLMSWEKRGDDVHLTEKQKKLVVKSLYSIDNDNEIKDISYEKNNLTIYDKFLELN